MAAVTGIFYGLRYSVPRSEDSDILYQGVWMAAVTGILGEIVQMVRARVGWKREITFAYAPSTYCRAAQVKITQKQKQKMIYHCCFMHDSNEGFRKTCFS